MYLMLYDVDFNMFISEKWYDYFHGYVDGFFYFYDKKEGDEIKLKQLEL